jgi:DNA adenine methylase
VSKRPIVRYHGGKWRQAERIISFMPAHAIYVEPFGGAASVLLQKPRVMNEIYNDLDGNIVNLFRVLRDPELSDRLHYLVTLTPFARDEFLATYDPEPSDDPVDRAHRILVLGAMGFGSDSVTRSCRTGFRSRINIHGNYAASWARWPHAVQSIVERLRGVVIENRDALQIIKQFDSKNTCFYVDPPYVFDTRSSLRGRSKRTHGYLHELTDDQHRELAAVLSEVEGSVILSGYPSALYDELFGDWERQEFSALADGSRPRTEVLWINRHAQVARSQRHLFEECAA